MPDNRSLRIGLIVDSSVQQHALRGAIESTGHKLVQSFLTEQCELEALQSLQGELDAWLVDVDFSQANSQLESWLEATHLPVVVGEGEQVNPGSEDYPAWLRRLSNKLHQLTGELNLEQHPTGAAREVWVLGASTGGPDAVRRFIELLPPKLDVAFIYVQHIDPGFEQTLTDVLVRNGEYPAYQIKHGDVLHDNGIAVVRSDQQVELQENGTFVERVEPWPGPYSPSVDQVVANVARSFPNRCGVIIFTGMGDDGAVSCRLMHQRGGPVWVQTPADCTVSSMPDSVLATGVVEKIGSPEELAASFIEHIKQLELVNP